MSPKAAIFFFLLSAGLLFAILLPRTGEAGRPADKEASCTLGACPLTITSRDDGRTLNYPIGSEISFLTDKKLEVQCMPRDAMQELAFSPDGPGSLRMKALRRGNCVIQNEDLSVSLSISRFR